MRPAVTAVIHRICSGTSVPGPRTWRIIVPCSTVSRQIVPPSTVGAADGSDWIATVMMATPPMMPLTQTIRFFFFCGLVSRMMSTMSFLCVFGGWAVVGPSRSL